MTLPRKFDINYPVHIISRAVEERKIFSNKESTNDLRKRLNQHAQKQIKTFPISNGVKMRRSTTELQARCFVPLLRDSVKFKIQNSKVKN